MTLSPRNATRKAAPVALSLLLLLGLAGCDSAQERAQNHYERGLEFVTSGEDDKASLEFRNALRLDGEMALARLEMAKLSERRGDMRGAAGNYRAAVEAQGENGEARLGFGRILLAVGEIDDAEIHLTEAVRLRPDDADAHSAYAALMVRRDRLDEALDAAAKALAIDPGNQAAHLARASVSVRNGDLEGAIGVVEARLAEAPADLALNMMKLQILSQINDGDRIEAHLVAMSDLFPDNPEFRRTLAQVRIRRDDIDGAEAVLREMVEEGVDQDAQQALTAFLLQQRGLAAAEADIADRIATADAGSRDRLRATQIDLTVRAGRPDEAIALTRALLEDGTDAEIRRRARVRLATLLVAQGQIDEAATLIAAALEDDPRDAEALATRAAVAIDQLRPQDAIVDIRAALAGDPQNARYMLIEATAQERAGNLSAAAERLGAAARASEFAPEFALRYAQFLQGRNDLSAAEAALAESLRRHPGDTSILTRMASVQLGQQRWDDAEATAGLLRAAGQAVAADQVTAAARAGKGRGDEGIAILERAAEELGGEQVLAGLVVQYVRAGRIEDAIRVVDDRLTTQPDDVTANLLRAELHMFSQEWEPAAAVLDRLALEIAPTEAPVHVARARYRAALGDQDGAIIAARDGIDATDGHQAVRLMLAQLLEARQDYKAALDIYRDLYNEAPDSVLLANNFASLAAEFAGDDPAILEEAARVAQRLRGYDVAEFKDTYGWIAFLQGDVAAAAGPLTEAAAALPQNPLVRYHAGRALAALGQTAEAREHLEASLNLDPNFPKADSARAAVAELEDK